MIKWLTIIGLILIPFAHISGCVDQAWLKEWLAFVIAMSIASYALYNGGIRCIDNKWFLICIGAMLVSTMFVPNSGLRLGSVSGNGSFVFVDQNMDNLWNFKPILLAIIYLLMACAIAQVEWDYKLIIKVISWVGLLMALVVIFQKFGFQQFWRVKEVGEIGPGAHNLGLTGFMAQYSLVAAFLAICFVASLYIKDHNFSFVIAVAILLTGSCFAIFSILLSTILRYGAKNAGSVVIICVAIILLALGINHFHHFNDDGRYGVWKILLHDMTNPLYDIKTAQSQGFTGFGAGAFTIFFPILHQSPWGKAHNEFLEFLFNNGIFGLAILVTAIGVFIRQCFNIFSDENVRFCLLTFIAICVLSCGTFPLHLGWGQFYTAVILGLGYSLISKNKKEMPYGLSC